MAWHDEPAQRPAQAGIGGQQVRQHGLLAFTRAREHGDGPVHGGVPGTPARLLVRIGCGVELEVAEHADHRRAGLAQPRRVVLGLRTGGHQTRVGRRQQGHALCAAQRLGRQPRIGQHQRHARAPAARDQPGPDLGLHEHADPRAELRDEAARGARRVPGLPDLQVARAQQPRALGPARGRAVREQQPHAGQALAQRGDEHGRGPRLAQRDRMHPDPAAGRGLRVVAKALGHMRAIAGLGLRAARELAAQQRLREPGQPAVQAQQHQRGTGRGVAASTPCQAAQTSSTLGARSPPTGTWCA